LPFLSTRVALLILKFDCTLSATAHTGPAENAFCIFHNIALNHFFNRQTHRTFFRADMAVLAQFGLCRQLQGRPLQKVSGLATQNHEGRHPAEMMAE